MEAKLAITEIIGQELTSGRKKMRQKVARCKGDGELVGSNNRDTIDVEATNVTGQIESLNWMPSLESADENSSDGDDVKASLGPKKRFQAIVRERNPKVINDENREGVKHE